METVLQIFFLAVGFTMLIKGVDFFVVGSSGIASRFGIPQIVVGLTIGNVVGGNVRSLKRVEGGLLLLGYFGRQCMMEGGVQNGNWQSLKQHRGIGCCSQSS